MPSNAWIGTECQKGTFVDKGYTAFKVQYLTMSLPYCRNKALPQHLVSPCTSSENKQIKNS